MVYTAADLAYVHASYTSLEQLCEGRSESPAEVRALIAERRLPAPSYVLDDGTELFPADYFALVDAAGGPARLREHFADRWRDAGGRGEPDEDWTAYLDGIYGVCLREVTPETIVRKDVLVTSLGELLANPQPRDAEWRRTLRAQVEELDALERDFAPDYDRNEQRFGRPPTRDLLINAARGRFPQVFGPAVSGRRRARSGSGRSTERL